MMFILFSSNNFRDIRIMNVIRVSAFVSKLHDPWPNHATVNFDILNR